MTEESRPRSLGERLRKSRENVGISQRELGRLTRVSYTFISRLESGDRTNIDVWVLRRIARVLKVGIDYLVDTFNGEHDDPYHSPEGVHVLTDATPLPVTTL